MNVSRINGPNRQDRVAKKPAARSGRSQDVFQAPGTSSVKSQGGPGNVSSLSSVDAVLALQSVPDALSGRRRAVKRAENMLDVLEDLKIDLLGGNVPQTRLDCLIGFVNAQRDKVNDPKLDEILDEIELRAKVELAKFGQFAA